MLTLGGIAVLVAVAIVVAILPCRRRWHGDVRSRDTVRPPFEPNRPLTPAQIAVEERRGASPTSATLNPGLNLRWKDGVLRIGHGLRPRSLKVDKKFRRLLPSERLFDLWERVVYVRRLAFRVVTAAAFAAAVTTAFVAIRSSPETEAERRGKGITISGYQRISSSSDSRPGTSSASSYFLGGAVSGNLPRVLSRGAVVPLELANVQVGFEEQIGRGDLGEGCRILVSKLRPGMTPPDYWHVTKDEKSALEIGQDNLLDVTVVCGKG